jgi:transcription-repair coupling factor (superfamily II helicase)
MEQHPDADPGARGFGLSDLKNRFAGHPAVQSADLRLKGRASLHFEGLTGSAAPLVADALMGANPELWVFILPDREEAAYFLNDLERADTGRKLLYLPDSGRVAYNEERTQNANVSMRAEVLSELAKDPARCAVVTYPEALAEKVITKKLLEKNTFGIEPGQHFDMEFLDEVFHDFGFEKTDFVHEPGQYAVRGGIVDVFSFSYDHPYRIEFFGDEVESIRKFDPVTQLSVARMARASIVPAMDEKLLSESREAFFSFIPESSILWIHRPEMFADLCGKEIEKARKEYASLSDMMNHLPPDELYLKGDEALKLTQPFRRIETGPKAVLPGSETIRFNTGPQPRFSKNFDLLGNDLKALRKAGFTTLIASANPKQIERLYQIFEDKDHEVNFTPLTVEFSEGFVDQVLKIALYTDHQIFERYHKFRLKEGFRKSKEALTIKELTSLQPGDFVVHTDHGVGQFSGLEKIDVNGKQQEAIRLIYKGGDILYVSVHSLHRISKYTGKEGTVPTTNKLGSPAWQALKSKTKKRVKEIAFDLIKLYAQRKKAKGFAFSPDTYLQTELEASFMYEDTPDQLKATLDVKKDMESPAPMDRLICGDVGFGKTEVAVRAAFKAVADSKQVAILVPTTILSMQHYRTFRDRLKEFPCRVDFINRFKTGKKLTETLQDLEEGKVDIIVGTHALVGSRVKFKDLGLLIIDEEQKFGVGVKDKLKTFKANVDTLTMTATPIPRTLQFSLMAARDLSTIATPPPNRQPVQTEIRAFNEEIIRDAVTYEVQRGGQVFFIHNRVSNIREVAGMIQRLCPDVRIGIGHGQMEGEKLEEVITDFMEGGIDVLVSTTIVESGIDIPNANTMIINEAHSFGLSDLHQMRGRVGRSNRKAFCYLLAPPLGVLPPDTRKRLQAIEQFSDLGSGIQIAMRDLDIRGAGDLLGADQSGFINEIGFETYHKILNEAVRELKENDFKELFEDIDPEKKQFVNDTQFETDLHVMIPDDYVSDITERIRLYRELDEMNTEEELEVFGEILTDRFGPMPLPVIELLDTIRLRTDAKTLGIEKLILKSEKLICTFIARPDSPFYQSDRFSRVLNFVKDNSRHCKLYQKDDTLRLAFAPVRTVHEAMEKLRAVLHHHQPTTA